MLTLNEFNMQMWYDKKADMVTHGTLGFMWHRLVRIFATKLLLHPIYKQKSECMRKISGSLS